MQRLFACLAALLMAISPGFARAADLVVMTSGGFSAPYRALAPGYEKQSGDHLTIVYGPSMGATPQAIPTRLASGETADVLIMVGPALQQLAQKGLVAPDSEVVLANSIIGMAVREGAPKPPIATVEEFKRTLLAAHSIAYSDSASGVYIGTTMYQKLGLEAELAPKSRMIPRDPVGDTIARGEAEIGFQQISELLPVHGITIVGPIPQEVQLVTPYTAGIPVASHQADAAHRFIAYLASAEAAPTLQRLGLEPTTDAH
jgi:molybdate transport system substrate-binding protein